MRFPHAVPSKVRELSRWDPDNFVWVTPEGHCWCYVNPGLPVGVEWRDSTGEQVLVARWIPGQSHRPYSRCLRRNQAERLIRSMLA